MLLLTLGISHHTAPLALREKLALADSRLPEALEDLRSVAQISESTILSTCNRTEIVAIAQPQSREHIEGWLSRFFDISVETLHPHLYLHEARHCVAHLCRVASGLDSMVLGEPQILGQMKQAYLTARECNNTGPILNRLYQHAFSAAKTIRTETAIGENPVSVAFAAVSMARGLFSDFNELTAVLVGAGEMIDLSARHLAERGLHRMIVANRSIDHAAEIANRHHGFAISLDELNNHLPDADIIISSTASPEPLIHLEQIKQALKQRKRKPMFLVDLAVPRDIDPEISQLEDAYLYSIDDLHAVVDENRASRRDAARHAEKIVEKRADEFLRWLDVRDGAKIIRALHERADTLRSAELTRAQAQLQAGKSAEVVMDELASRLTKKLIHDPTTALRESSEQERDDLARSATQLFRLQPPPSSDSNSGNSDNSQ